MWTLNQGVLKRVSNANELIRFSYNKSDKLKHDLYIHIGLKM